MKYRTGPLLLALGGALGLPLLASDGEGTTEAFSYRAIEKWDFILPSERWTKIDGSIDLPTEDGAGFLAEALGPLKLAVDTDGNGRTDKEVRGERGFLKLRGVDPDGQKFNYGVRIRKSGDNWEFASSGVWSGKIGGTSVKLIDQDNDGRFDEAGVDAMVVGKGPAATLLSEVVSTSKGLFEVEVSPNGREVTTRAFEGETGTLDVRSEFDAKGKLMAAVVSSLDGDLYFDAARGLLEVPVGEYRLHSGLASKGNETVRIRAGRLGAFRVEPAERKILEWGGPVIAEFDYSVAGETITVQPNVAFFGRAGEEYFEFAPNAKSPKIIVLDSQTRREVASGRFGGC